MKLLKPNERIHLVDTKERQYALILKPGEVFQHSGETIPHDDIIGKPDGTFVRLSRGRKMMVLSPTLAEYTLKMPRGAQVLYPKDLAMITMWADVYPGAKVFEAGVGSGALTLALLRAVGEQGRVVSYEIRDDFAKTAMKNIERYLGAVSQFQLIQRDAYEGIECHVDGNPPSYDRVVLDLPEPWRVVEHAERVLRLGGIYLSFVPTIPQVMQTVEALTRSGGFTFVQTFETLFRDWNIQGRSVRPDLRMVAHSGFITVARRVEGWKEETTVAVDDISRARQGEDSEEAIESAVEKD
ncbi:MAG: tRNA (adenine-N1)-methyltransferase [Nitrospirota bacterium]|nr:tRNA (adenine-N1)-methyltransferase [Nitrospirota bacterium]